MSVDEVIAEVRKLKPEDQARVRDVLRETEPPKSIRFVDSKSFDRTAERVVEQHADLLRKLAQ
jgi:hypothetical protein